MLPVSAKAITILKKAWGCPVAAECVRFGVVDVIGVAESVVVLDGRSVETE